MNTNTEEKTTSEPPNLISAINDCIHDIHFYDGKLKELLEEVNELKEQRKEIVDTLGRYIQNRKQHLQQSITRSGASLNSATHDVPDISGTRTNTSTESSSNTLREEDPNMSAEQRSDLLNMLHGGSQDFFREDAELREHMNTRRKKMHEMLHVSESQDLNSAS